MLELTHIATSELERKAAPYNPRRISDHDLEALRRSLRFFGTVEPIVVNRRFDRIVGGHQRVKAAAAEGIEALPVVYVDLDDPSEKQLNLALNRIHGEWNPEALEAVLRDLEQVGAALDLTGFTTEELDELLRGTEEARDGLTDPDAVPEPPEEPVTQRGDLIVLGNHRLLCGDSADRADLTRLLDGARIHLVNTDPPYNVKVEPRSNNAIASGLNTKGNVPATRRGLMPHQGLDLARHPGKAKPTGPMRAKDRPLQNDFVSDEEFARLLAAWFGNMAEALEPGRAFYAWGGYSNIKNYPAAIEGAGLYFSQAIIWDKQWPVLTRKDFMGAHEWCQPAETAVLTPDGSVPIGSLRDGDRVVGFRRADSVLCGRRDGTPVRCAARDYRGRLMRVDAAGRASWTTPGHVWSIRLGPRAAEMWCVYLMRRGTWWRIGKSRLISSWGFGVKHRIKTEDGDAAWILSVHPSNLEAALHEQVAQAKYGIPTTTWAETYSSRRTLSDVTRLYDLLDPERLQKDALRALDDHGRDPQYPFLDRVHSRDKVSRRVAHLVRTCNILPGVMMIPVPGGERPGPVAWAEVNAVSAEPFSGTVYSLDVPRHRHYVADGLVTHNCFYGWKEGAAHWFNPAVTNATDLWQVKKIAPPSMVHLTEKPTELAERAMHYSSRPGEHVLDLFGGSGSTLIAAERMDRRAFLMEIDPAYCDVIVTRWEQFTARRAVRP